MESQPAVLDSKSTPKTATPSSTADAELEKQARMIFDKFDTNKDGFLTFEELRHGLRAMRLPSRKDQVESIFVQIDKNRDRKVAYEEFEAFVKNQSKLLRETFNEWDQNGDGYISEPELKASLISLGLPFDDTELHRLFLRFDKDKNGKISFDEWQEILLLIPLSNALATFRYWEDALALETGEQDSVLAHAHTKSLKDRFGHFFAGSVAGIASRTGTAPLDRLKILLQVNTGPARGIVQTIKDIYQAPYHIQEGGIRAFWRGNLANVLKVAPESGIKFLTYEYVKGLFAERDADITPAQRMIAGASAGVATHTAIFPLEVIKTRLAASSPGQYTGMVDVIVKIIRHEGSILPFYRGLSASIMSTIPHASIDLTVYELLKNWFLKRHPDSPPTTMELLLAAGGASTCGQVLAFPFHLVKTRYIAHGKGGHHAHAAPGANILQGIPAQAYKGLLDVFVKTYKAEGFLGFYRGIIPNFMKSLPSHGITFLVYEYFKRYLGIEKHKKH